MALAPDETTIRHRIPVTTPARTILDLAPDLPAGALAGVVREAEYAHGLDLRELAGLLDRHPGRRGSKAVASSLRELGFVPKGRTRSPLEDRFAALIRRHDLPRSELNVLIELDGELVEADCLFRRQRLIVELDGRRSHGTNTAFQGDRARDRQLLALGWRTVRVTHSHLDHPAPLLSDLRRLLGSDESARGVT